MYKDVVTLLARDEAKALFCIEKFYCTLCHEYSIPKPAERPIRSARYKDLTRAQLNSQEILDKNKNCSTLPSNFPRFTMVICCWPPPDSQLHASIVEIRTRLSNLPGSARSFSRCLRLVRCLATRATGDPVLQICLHLERCSLCSRALRYPEHRVDYSLDSRLFLPVSEDAGEQPVAIRDSVNTSVTKRNRVNVESPRWVSRHAADPVVDGGEARAPNTPDAPPLREHLVRSCHAGARVEKTNCNDIDSSRTEALTEAPECHLKGENI